jgi:hypothetical protein
MDDMALTRTMRRGGRMRPPLAPAPPRPVIMAPAAPYPPKSAVSQCFSLVKFRRLSRVRLEEEWQPLKRQVLELALGELAGFVACPSSNTWSRRQESGRDVGASSGSNRRKGQEYQ